MNRLSMMAAPLSLTNWQEPFQYQFFRHGMVAAILLLALFAAFADVGQVLDGERIACLQFYRVGTCIVAGRTEF